MAAVAVAAGDAAAAELGVALLGKVTTLLALTLTLPTAT